MSTLELNELQRKNLSEVLAYAVKKVPFYTYLNIELNGNPYEDLKKFPITTKDTLRDHEDALISNDFTKGKLLASYSSGSSGIQSRIFMNKKEKSSNWGILLNIWMDQGYAFGDPVLQTGMSPSRGILKSIKDVLFKTTYINAFSHSEYELKKAVLKSVKKKNIVLIGYASSLNVIAEIVLKDNLNLQVKSSISFGDKLFDSYKKNIEKAVHVKVKESYGSNEGLMIAFQKDLEFMYIMSPHVYVEILDDEGNPVEDGEMGNIVVTRLDAFSMPLIRYKIGDLGILLPKEEYPKERKYQYPLLKKIIGRETDVVYLKNKKRLTVHSFTGVFEFIPEIKQFKVIQENTAGILIEYIKEKGFSNEILKKITEEIQKQINDSSFQIRYVEVDTIPPTKSGKPQIVESRLKK
jgi:phenylacetate-CoA ligase